MAKQMPNLDQPSEDVIDLAGEQMAESQVADDFLDVGKGKSFQFSGVLGVFGGLPFLLGGMVLSMIVMVWMLVINAQRSERESKYIEQSSQLLMLSQRIAKDAREAVLGQGSSFKTLKESRDRFDQIVNALKDGSTELAVPPSPPDILDGQLSEVIKLWTPKQASEGVRAEVDQILAQEKALFAMREDVVAINQTSPLLLALTDEIAEVGTQSGMKQADLYMVSRQGMLSQRIAKDVNLFSQGGNEAAVAAAQFGKDIKLFTETESQLRKTAPKTLTPKLDEMDAIFSDINKHVESILG